jgi:hypothetical protein
MKVHVEISYILENEPTIFTDISTLNSRSVYVWLNKRGYLKHDTPWQTFRRLSVMNSQPDGALMEVWSDDKNDISDPPNNSDDLWHESYKLIENKQYNMEWHPNVNMLRLVWLQAEDTLKDHKINTSVMALINDLGLVFPAFPTLSLDS